MLPALLQHKTPNQILYPGHTLRPQKVPQKARRKILLCSQYGIFSCFSLLKFWILLPPKKINPNLFFQKLTDFLKKKHCLLVSIWIAQLKGDVHGFGVTPMQEFFWLTLQRPAHSAPMGNLKFFPPTSLFFICMYVLGVLGLDEICRAGPYFFQQGLKSF